jgi:transposase
MNSKPKEITLNQLKTRIDETRSDHSLPPKVDQLLSMLWVTVQGLNDQLAEALEANQELVDERDRLKRELYGEKSEQAKPKSKPKKKKKKKRKYRDPERETLSKTPLPEEVQEHKAPKTCPKCGGDELRDLKAPKEHIEYKLRPATLIRVRHRLQKCVCTHGCTVVTATSPDRVGDSGTQFGPSVYAHIIASRTFDALPFSRLSDRWRRRGVPLHKSTISDLFHRGSEELKPLYDELLKVVCNAPLVHADETPQRYLEKPDEEAPDRKLTRLGYTWVFASGTLAAYVFAKSRKGSIASSVLKGSKGYLVADAYQGYNCVMGQDARLHVGCNAHARRNFKDAKSSDAEIAQQALDLIQELYKIESEVKKEGLQGSEIHAERRDTLSRAIMGRLETLIEENLKTAPPKSKIGKALSYMKNHWESLTRFLEDVSLPLDNNHAERLLRRSALARKTSLFIYSGAAYQVAYSLVQSCRLNGINPEMYLADVLIRVKSAKPDEIRELLPDRWKPPDGGLGGRWL